MSDGGKRPAQIVELHWPMKVALKLCILSRIFRCTVTTTAIFSNVQSQTRQYGYISLKAHHRVLKLFFSILQVMSEDLIILSRAVVLITYAWHVIQFMKNIILVVIVPVFMELSIKHIHLEYIPAVCTTTTSHVQCVMWLHVLHKWWYQVVTCVPRDGHANTKDTWWQNIMITYRTMYTCMDENPDYTRGTHADINGALFFFVEGVCGSLPCKPYIAGKELTCAVCTR